MQTQIPSGLQALMQASQILSSQASPTAPGPQGQQPTVAGRVNEQIKQAAQPQQPQQPQEGGIAGLNPSMREMGQQAGVAGQIMAQRQAQQQQQAQDPQAVAQMAAQMLQSKGVAGLPANMGFKEGGIIGFDGEERSDVPEVPGMEQLKQILENAEGTQVAAADNQVALQALADAQKRLAAATAAKDFPAVQVAAQEVSDLRKQIPPETPPSTRGTFTPRVIPTVNPQETGRHVTRGSVGATPPANAQRSMSPRQEPAVSSSYPDETRRGRATTPERGIPAALAAQTSQPAAPPRAAPPAAPRPPAPADGVTPENIANRATGILSALTAPTAESVAAGASKYYTDTTEADIKKERALEQERADLKKSMANLNDEGIAALQKERAARKQLNASKADRDQFNRVQSFFRDLYTRGDSYGTVQAGIFAREEADRLADLNTSKAIIELKKADQADKLGDVDRKLAAEQRYRGYKEKADHYKLQAAQIEGTRQSSVYSTQGQAATTAASTLSSELNNRRQIEQQSRDLAQRASAQKDAQLDRAIQAAISGVQSAQKEWDNVYLKNRMWLELPPAEIAKDPTIQAKNQAALAELDKIKKNTIDPAIANRDRLARQANIDLGGPKPGAASGGNAKPDFVWDQKSQKMVPNK